jgi:hypothetical protein
MDIQGYILDHWQAKMKPETPVIIIYDKEGVYYDLLPIAIEKGFKVIDTTKGALHARLSASRFWCNDLSIDKNVQMIIYRQRPMPTNNRSWVEEPFSCFMKSACIFPYGPQDTYENICRTFLPSKQQDLDKLFANGSTSFNMINALLDGAAYPELEQLTGGKSISEITVGLLALDECTNMNWQKEWRILAEVQFPRLDCTGVSLNEVQNKLWTYLLFSEFVFDLPGALPENLKSVPMAPVEMKEKVYMICDKLRNQINLRETYVRIANKVSEQLKLSEVFVKAKHLGERVTFNFENSVEYNRFIDYIKAGDIQEATRLISKNESGVWYQEEQEVSNYWKLAQHIVDLMQCINNGIETDGTLADLIEWYTNVGCVADNAFRKFHTDKLGMLHLPKQADELTNLINKHYREFTERGVKAYQQLIIDIKDYPKLRNQGYIQFVKPAIKNGKRVVFVMVDAFRYEMGKTFAKSIERNFMERVECLSRISYLPSITRFGMASHMGDISVRNIQGKLQPFIGEQMVSTPEDRITWLKADTNIEVQDFRLEEFNSAKVNDRTRLLVVRSVSIDSAGENDKLNGLATMEREQIRLAKLLDDCKRLKFDEAIIVADHGFMIQPSFNVGDLINKPKGSDISIEESRVIAGNLNDSNDTLSLTTTQLGNDMEVMKLSYAKDYTVFTRGEIYYHEGLSLQENVVPIIRVKLQEEKKRQSFQVSLSYKGKNGGTIFSRRPLIDINTTFANLFADDVIMKLKVTGDNDCEIGEAEDRFYDSVTGLIRIPSGATSVRQLINIRDEYHGNTVTMTALDTETNATLSTLRLNFEND